jgi:hypothetical protein
VKIQDARHIKRERLRSGVRHALEGKLDMKDEAARAELPPFFLREHHLCRFLAARYAESVATVVEGFPEGDAPEDVIESHVDALSFHDEVYAKKLFSSDDLIVRVLRGTCTVQRRHYQWFDPADIFTLGGRQFQVTDVRREKTGDVTLEEARREGATSLEESRRFWVENLPRAAGPNGWKPDQICVRHEFVATDLTRP